MTVGAERLLLGPGPSPVHPDVLAALGRPVLGHLDPVFLELLDETSERLRTVFRTSNRLTFAVSGTGSAGMEAALVNLLEPGDTAVVCVAGLFGTRMADIVRRTGAEPIEVEVQWGEAVSPGALEAALEQAGRVKLVAFVHAETSTGCAQPAAELARVARAHGALVVADTVTSLGGMPVDTDAWDVDVNYAGTQKCLSVPPGLAPITFSERALEAVRRRKSPPVSWYLDVSMLERYWGSERFYHHTAPTSMVAALHGGVRLLLEKGLEESWRRHAEVGAALRDGLSKRGFESVAAEPLPMLHCVRVPDGIEEAAVRKRLRDDYGIEIGGGLGPLAGRVWRIGLMGHGARRRNVLALLGALDEIVRP